MKERKIGDRYRPIVTIKKMKKGRPTVIEVSGNTYTLRHPNQFQGGK